MSGYFVIEGHDMVGKTTLINNVHKALQDKQLPSIATYHPGATPLGKVLRKLVKTPDDFEYISQHEIKIDPLSAQTLMFIDHMCFIETVLKPNLADDKIVLADRSNYISGIVYGISEGVSINSLNKIFQLIKSPVPNKVFILQIPIDEAMARYEQREKIKDRFEDCGRSFMEKVSSVYNGLTTSSQDVLMLLTSYVPLDNIIYLDATQSPEELTKIVVNIIEDTI